MLVFVFSCIWVNTDVWAVGGSGWDFALLRVPPSDPLWAWSLPTAGPSVPQNSASTKPPVPKNSASASTKPLVPQNTSPVFPPQSSVLTFCLSLALLPWPLFIMVALGFPQNLGQSSPINELWPFVFFRLPRAWYWRQRTPLCFPTLIEIWKYKYRNTMHYWQTRPMVTFRSDEQGGWGASRVCH